MTVHHYIAIVLTIFCADHFYQAWKLRLRFKEQETRSLKNDEMAESWHKNFSNTVKVINILAIDYVDRNKKEEAAIVQRENMACAKCRVERKYTTCNRCNADFCSKCHGDHDCEDF